MPKFAIETNALKRSAEQLRALAREQRTHAQGTQSILRGLSWELKAQEHFDASFDRTRVRLEDLARRLETHASFLAGTAVRYEEAEASLVGMANDLDGGAAAGVGSGGFSGGGGGGGGGGPWTDEGVVPVAWSEIVEKYAHDIGTNVTGNSHLGDAFSDLVDFGTGHIPYIGDATSLDTIINDLQRGDYLKTIWDVGGMIPIVDKMQTAWDFGFHLGEAIVETWPLPDNVSYFIVDVVDGTADYVNNFVPGLQDGIGIVSDAIGDGLGGIADGIGDGVDGVVTGLSQAWSGIFG